jgi:DNA-binding MarR family transcriptional regulator
MTIREMEEFAEEVQQWSEEELAEAARGFRNSYGRSLTLEEFRRLYEVVLTPKGQEYLRCLKKLFREIDSLVNDCDLSEVPSEWLLNRMSDGAHQNLSIHFILPAHFHVPAFEKLWLFALREGPEVVSVAYLMIVFGERCAKEYARRISPFSADVVGAVFLEGKSKTDSVEAIMPNIRACSQKLWLPQEKGTSEKARFLEKDGTLMLLLSDQLDELKKLSIEDFFIRAMEGKFDSLPDDVRKSFLKEIRAQRKWMGFVSLDEEFENEDGETVSRHGTIPAPTTTSEDTDVYVEILREKHGDKVAKTAEAYLEIHQGKKKVKRKQIAEVLGVDRETISRRIEKIVKNIEERTGRKFDWSKKKLI